MELSYILNHLGEEKENYYNAVTPPLFDTGNFSFNSVAEMRSKITNEKENPYYTRGCNPTVQILRKKIAALEKADDCLVFASGTAAIAAAILGNIAKDEHIICVKNPYSWTKKIHNNFLTKFGVETTYVDGKNVENFANAIQENTKIIYLESPNSITFEQQDIKAVAELAKSKGILTICDNSYASPLFQNPIEMGIDIVVHSASKYFSGHSDIVAGVMCGSQKMIDKLFDSQFMTLGGIISPHNAWLMIRSLRTFDIRMNQISENAKTVVDYLAKHPKVAKIYYPYHADNPQYDLAKKQMKKGAGQFSILLNTEKLSEIEAFCDNLKYFLIACSWGGHESLIYPVSALSESGYYKENPFPINLIRFYVGLENPNVLIKDLEQAFQKI